MYSQRRGHSGKLHSNWEATTGGGGNGRSKGREHSERVAAQAARLKGQYLPALLKSREAKEVAAVVSHLRLLGERLLGGRSMGQTAKTVGDICAALRGVEDPVSAPQLLESGLVHTLGLFLAGSDLREEADCAGSAAAPADDEPPSWAATAAERQKIFLEAATLEQGAGASALSVLQKKLVEAVGDLEQFTVTDARPAEEAFQTLGRPLRLRLRRAAPAAGEAPLRDFSQQVVLIEPLASVAAVTRFLAPRVQQPDNPRSSTRSEGAVRREAAPGADALEEEQQEEQEQDQEGEDMSDAEWCEEDEEDEELDDLDEEEMDIEDDLDGNDEPVDVGDGGDAEADGADRDGGAGRGGSRRGEAAAQQGQGASGAGEPAPPRSPTGVSTDPGAGGGLWRRGPPRPRPSGLDLRVISPEGETLEPTTTILETILRCSTSGAAEGNSSLPLWERVFTLEYRRAREGEEQKQGPSRRSSAVAPAAPGHTVILGAADLGKLVEARLGEADEGLLQLEGWVGAEKLAQVLKLLHLLQMARDVRRLGRRGGEAPTDGGAAGTLVCGSAASKFAYQLQDILAVCGGSLPAWVSGCALRCPYLLPFKSRRDYFRLNAFGVQHALLHLQQGVAAAAAANGVAVGAGGGGEGSERQPHVQLQRQKVRVNRRHILQCAEKVMGLPGGPQDLLEIEYHGEEGSGLGPTLEFYSLLSRELSRRTLGLWRTEEAPPPPEPSSRKGAAGAAATCTGPGAVTDADRAWAPGGLFPEPYPPEAAAGEAGKQRAQVFRTLGFFVGRALKDSRLLDLDLSETFWKVALGRPVGLADLHAIDSSLGASLAAIMESAGDDCSPGAGDAAPASLHGVEVEDLVLDFTLPGRAQYELCLGGARRSVTGANAREYARRVVEATLVEGVEPQFRAFREGVDSVFPIKRLAIFTESEIATLVAGERSPEPWSASYLRDHMVLDHGYDAGSPAIGHLVRVMSGFDGQERRAFLRFITGSPCLPYGGLAALRPKLTVVCKLPPGVASPQKGGPQQCDEGLPSVMTCANYLKLPPFSSEAIMREKLLYAISEGQGSFHLS